MADPAPDLRTLLDFETNIEAKAKLVLVSALDVQASAVFATGDQDDLIFPSVGVRLDIEEALDPYDIARTEEPVNNDLEYRKFRATMQVRITTDASVNGTETEHRRLRALARAALLRNAGGFSDLLYYDIKYIRPTQTDFTSDGDAHISTLSYEIHFAIRGDAWPFEAEPDEPEEPDPE